VQRESSRHLQPVPLWQLHLRALLPRVVVELRWAQLPVRS
jgi:hypothetical protein